MSRSGFSINRAVARKDWGFDEFARPFFHKGNDVGCLVLHGFLGTPANVRVVADALAAHGWTVYAPLLSGHGTTLEDMDQKSDEDWIGDAFSAYERLKLEGCTRIIVLGLSMGGLLASNLAQQVECAGLVLLNTPFRMRGYLRRMARLAGAAPFLQLRGTKSAGSAPPYDQLYGGLPVHKLRDLERMADRARAGLNRIRCPLLVMQSRRDDKVDLKSVSILHNGIKSERVLIEWLENSPHGCTYGPERERIAERCARFVSELLEERAPGK